MIGRYGRVSDAWDAHSIIRLVRLRGAVPEPMGDRVSD